MICPECGGPLRVIQQGRFLTLICYGANICAEGLWARRQTLMEMFVRAHRERGYEHEMVS